MYSPDQLNEQLEGTAQRKDEEARIWTPSRSQEPVSAWQIRLILVDKPSVRKLSGNFGYSSEPCMRLRRFFLPMTPEEPTGRRHGSRQLFVRRPESKATGNSFTGFG